MPMLALPGDEPRGPLKRFGRFIKNTCFPWTATPDAMVDTTAANIANQRFLQDRQFDFQMAQMKYQHTMEISRREWQSQESAIQRQWQERENRILQEFQAAQAEIQRQWGSLEADKQRQWQERQNVLQQEFQAWVVQFNQECQERQLRSRQEYEQYVLEQRHHWEVEAQKRAHQFQLFLEQFRVQATRDRDQFNLVLRDQPWKTQPMPILHEYEQFRKVNQPLPPMVVVSPAEFRFNCPVKVPEAPNVAKGIESCLTHFLEDHYPKESSVTPARPVPGLWNGSGKSGDPAVIDLHFLFQSVPSIILESEINAGKLSFRIFFWDAGQQTYSKTSILRDFDYQQFLQEIQKQKAREWFEEKQLRQSKNLDIARAMLPGSENAVNDYNLQQLIHENEDRANGITNTAIHYLPTPSGIQALMEYLGVLHCLTAGLFLDSYHLFRSGVRPQMPHLVGDLAARLPEGEVQGLVDVLLNYCQDLLAEQEQLGDLQVPELMLEFALGLSELEDSTATARLTQAALEQWLELRRIALDANLGQADRVRLIAASLTIADQGFVEKLNRCWERLRCSYRLDVADACYQRGLNHLQAGNYPSAIGDFDQVIYLQPQNASAYLQRGLAYLGLEQEVANQQALADFEQILVRNPNQGDAYRWRGEAHYRLGHYEQALADLREAANRGVAEAGTRWQIVQGVFKEIDQQKRKELDRLRLYKLKGLITQDEQGPTLYST